MKIALAAIVAAVACRRSLQAPSQSRFNAPSTSRWSAFSRRNTARTRSPWERSTSDRYMQLFVSPQGHLDDPGDQDGRRGLHRGGRQQLGKASLACRGRPGCLIRRFRRPRRPRRAVARLRKAPLRGADADPARSLPDDSPGHARRRARCACSRHSTHMHADRRGTRSRGCSRAARLPRAARALHLGRGRARQDAAHGSLLRSRADDREAPRPFPRLHGRGARADRPLSPWPEERRRRTAATRSPPSPTRSHPRSSCSASTSSPSTTSPMR